MNEKNEPVDSSKKILEALDKKTPKAWHWGASIEASEEVIKKYEADKAKYDEYVANYRRSHNGDNPPERKLMSLPMQDLLADEEEGEDEYLNIYQ